MSLLKQTDVKNHLSPSFRTQIHLVPPVSQPDATGYSVAEPDTTKPNPLNLAEDFVAENSSSGLAVAPTDPVTGSIRPQAPAESKSVRS